MFWVRQTLAQPEKYCYRCFCKVGTLYFVNSNKLTMLWLFIKLKNKADNEILMTLPFLKCDDLCVFFLYLEIAPKYIIVLQYSPTLEIYFSNE